MYHKSLPKTGLRSISSLETTSLCPGSPSRAGVSAFGPGPTLLQFLLPLPRPDPPTAPAAQLQAGPEGPGSGAARFLSLWSFMS